MCLICKDFKGQDLFVPRIIYHFQGKLYNRTRKIKSIPSLEGREAVKVIWRRNENCYFE